MKQKILQTSNKFNTIDKYTLKTKDNGDWVTKYNLKYKEIDGMRIGGSAAKAVDTGNELEINIDGDLFVLNYSQAALLRLLLQAIALKEDPTLKTFIY